eukprot:Pgem_evm1s17157
MSGIDNSTNSTYDPYYYSPGYFGFLPDRSVEHSLVFPDVEATPAFKSAKIAVMVLNEEFLF